MEGSATTHSTKTVFQITGAQKYKNMLFGFHFSQINIGLLLSG